MYVCMSVSTWSWLSGVTTNTVLIHYNDVTNDCQRTCAYITVTLVVTVFSRTYSVLLTAIIGMHTVQTERNLESVRSVNNAELL